MSGLVTCADTAELAAEAARRMGDVIEGAVRERGRARVALSGGSTPLGAYRALAARAGVGAHVDWFFVDERCVPPDDARSNHAAIQRSLFDPGRIDPDTVHRMRGEVPDPERAAREYEAELCAAFGLARNDALCIDPDGRAPVRFDLLIAGIGTDGHTASLFPGTGSVARTDALVVAVHPGGGLEPRLSLSRPVLVAARSILVLCAGAEKRPVLAHARTPGSEEEIPARLYLGAEAGAVTWIADRGAAG